MSQRTIKQYLLGIEISYPIIYHVILIYSPYELEYDEDIYDTLNSLNTTSLVRSYNLHCEALDGRRIGYSAHTKMG